MTIHALAPLPQQAAVDTAATGEHTAYDSVWANGKAANATAETMPVQEQSALESVMLSHEKIYVVLAVVLIIWLGLAFLIFRTDRRLDRLEKQLDDTT